MTYDDRHRDASERLRSILTPTDSLAVDEAGRLTIEGCTAVDLLSRFGSPLFVISEATLRANYRRVRDAFASHWPAPVNVMYATKANNNLAVRALLTDEGAGGDCFGEGEIHASFQVDADGMRFVLNGSNKTDAALLAAAARDMIVNVDAEDEVDRLAQIGRESGRPVRAGIRLKVIDPGFGRPATDYFGSGPGGLVGYVKRVKWGFTPDGAEPLIRRMIDSPHVDFRGYHFHIGRATRDPAFHEAWGGALGRTIVELAGRTGFHPWFVDIGGGWARQRDPESKGLAMNPVPVEEYAQVVCGKLLAALEAGGIEIPQLWLEPGRYIVGNGVVLLTTVGAIKEDLGSTWVNVDASTNDLPRIDTSGSAYHVLPAARMTDPFVGPVTVVGPTCTDSILAADRRMPSLDRGDALAVLDAGMYAESASTQFNSVGRPASVLVDGDQAELVKERETTEDVFVKHRIPARLRTSRESLAEV